jgi:Citrate transporter
MMRRRSGVAGPRGLAVVACGSVALATSVAAQETHGAMRVTTDPVSQGIVAVIVLALFTLLVIELAHRVLVVMLAAALLLGITYLTPYHLMPFEGIKDALDINVLVLLAAMMALVGVLKTTGVFEWGVARVVRRAGGRPPLLLGLVLAFTDVGLSRQRDDGGVCHADGAGGGASGTGAAGRAAPAHGDGVEHRRHGHTDW